MSNEDTLISKLIEETCNDHADKDQLEAVVDLRNYFEKRLNQVDYLSLVDYLNQQQLPFESLSYIQDTCCYQLICKDIVLDFPSNWSVFQNIETNKLIFIDREVDHDFLLDIFTEVTGNFRNIAIINEDQKINLVFLDEHNSSDHTRWMEEYFLKKSEADTNKKAA